MKTLLECIENISLYDFIIESQIEIKDLRNKMHFVEIRTREAREIIDTDEYKHATELGFDDAEGLYIPGTGFINTKHYKITYDDNILGLIGYSNFRMLRSYDSDKDGIELCSVLTDALNAAIADNFDNLGNSKDVLKELQHNCYYITYLQISEEAKKKIDISPIGIIKVLVEKIVDFLKENNIKYVCAFGKDSHRTLTYIKALGFTNISDETLKTNKVGKKFVDHVGYSTAKCFVIKKVD